MKKRKLKWKSIIILILIALLLTVFVISTINIIKWLIDDRKIDLQVDDILSITNIEEVIDNENTEIIDDSVDEKDSFWNYIKMGLINVDFTKLKEYNSSTVGWLQINGTNVNYPFVQAKDNKYYLNHSFDKSSNGAGWIFMDYRNSSKLEDKNTILYGHGRSNSAMFGTLKKILTNGWLKDKNNYVVKISTEKENSLWQVFSVYHIPTTSDYLQVDFDSDEEFLKFANKLKDRSEHDFNTSIAASDKIISLSTCYSDTEKLVVHAKLIKKEAR